MNGERKVLAICLPGEKFTSTWVAYWTVLFADLSPYFVIRPLFGYSSDVEVTRSCLAREVLALDPPADLVLWIDDDNLITPEQVRKLAADLEYLQTVEPEFQRAVAVAGWCWIQADVEGEVLGPSCGRLDEDRLAHPFNRTVLETGRIVPIDYTGFPAVLMTREVIERAGPHAFLKIPNPKATWGTLGEDVSFCVRTAEAGARWFVDTSIEVPHLKLRAVKNPRIEVLDLAEKAA